VTYWCEQLKDIGTEVRGRVFAPYNDVDDVKQLDLDSLLSYLQSIKLRVGGAGGSGTELCVCVLCSTATMIDCKQTI